MGNQILTTLSKKSCAGDSEITKIAKSVSQMSVKCVAKSTFSLIPSPPQYQLSDSQKSLSDFLKLPARKPDRPTAGRQILRKTHREDLKSECQPFTPHVA
jgi:hypothetical protein